LFQPFTEGGIQNIRAYTVSPRSIMIEKRKAKKRNKLIIKPDIFQISFDGLPEIFYRNFFYFVLKSRKVRIFQLIQESVKQKKLIHLLVEQMKIWRSYKN